ncbi:post-GPI attachment to proteins factor 3-like [Salvia hispanica]|uniref:post-GPI attachment to proteins factor 3-like n=1 Tax=Salvia hispanica TaxID=49212 RepID=UPI002009D296|nr:post-GPI attachment to proteins factor 3-like [Salvia hispanica]
MASTWFLPFALALSCFFGLLRGSPGDADSVYQACVLQCEKTGCVGDKCFQHCNFSSDGNPIDGPWYLQEPLYIQWKQWDCRSDCRYQRLEAIRVMIAAPVFGILTTHILYMNFYEFDYGWNARVCAVISALQIAIWAVWAAQARHPQRWKLWVVVCGGAIAMLVTLYDFPPWRGLLDARALWHATMIPLSYLWWSFVKDDSVWMTSLAINKNK